MTPRLLALDAAVVTVGFLGLGYLLAEALLRRRGVDRPTLWGLAFPAATAYVLLLMLAHIATGGQVFSSPWVVRGVTLAVTAGLITRKLLVRRRDTDDRESLRTVPGWLPLLPPALLVLAAMVVWGTPVARMLPLDSTGDTTLHTGWTSQLLVGEPVPSGAITGDIPNFYPWLFHAVTAFLARFTIGGRAYHALAPLQLIQVSAAVLGLYALGREVGRRWGAGAGSALFGAMAGGVGFVLARGPDVIVAPRGAAGVRYMGDLFFKRSYNSAFLNLSPPFPRDVAFTLLIGFLVVLVVGLRRRSLPLLAAAGCALGLIGLTGGESFLIGGGTAALVLLLPGQNRRLRSAAVVFGPAVLLYALWLVPMAAAYLQYGFANITLVGPVVLPPAAVLVAWGVTTPFALYGVWHWVPRARDDAGARVLLALLTIGVGSLLFSTLVPLLGDAFVTLGRKHRYWPLLHFGLALYAGQALSDLAPRLARRSAAMATSLVAVTVLVAVASPVLASLALPDKLRPPGYLARALRGADDAFLNVLSPRSDENCVVAGPVRYSVRVFAYTGWRSVMYAWRGYETNQPRLRWRRIYEHIPGEQQRRADNAVLSAATADPELWRRLVRDYGVDVVVVPAAHRAAPAIRGLPATPVSVGLDELLVVRLTACGR